MLFQFPNCIPADFCYVFAVMGFFLRFEDDSVESAKIVKQWNVKIISVRSLFSFFMLLCFDPSFVKVLPLLME